MRSTPLTGLLTGSAAGHRDDRILPVTRWAARFIIPFLAAAFLVLYGVPDRTTEFFAWTIRPEMTAIIMGAGYGAGVYFFYRVATGSRWHAVAPVFLGIAAFTWAMAIATVLHWAAYNHGHHTFVLWVFLYAVTPLLIPGLWLLNRRTDPDEFGPRDVPLPGSIRLGGAILGFGITVTAIVLFIAPELMIATWPWIVYPLTGRVLAGWFALLGVVNVAAAFDRRWSAIRILVQSQLLGFGLVLAGAVRVWDNFDPSNPLTWGVVGGMGLYFIALLGLYWHMEARQPA